jgi:hypothetical protein
MWWRRRWWLAGDVVSEAIDGIEPAAKWLVRHFAQEAKPVRVRLVYQPETLESVLVGCPHGARRELAQALAPEFPALASGDRAWGFEPVLTKAEAASTILHFEREPGLIALATRLAEHGIAVDSAWPLTTFLQAVPAEWSQSGALAVLAIGPDEAVAFRHTRAGEREVQRWSGSALKDASSWLASTIGEDLADSVVVVTDSAETQTALAEVVGVQIPGLEVYTIAQVLRRHVVLPRYHPAQLLPREPTALGAILLKAASVTLFLTAGALAGLLGFRWHAARGAEANDATQLATLQTELRQLRANAAELATLEATSAVSPPVTVFLDRLARTIPPDVVLASVRVDAGGVTCAGWVLPSATGALTAWQEALRGPWSLNLSATADGAFSVKGNFR